MVDSESLANAAVYYIGIWTEAVGIQAERIILNQEQQDDERSVEGGYLSVGLILAQQADSHLFVMALHQLRMAALLFQNDVLQPVADEIGAIIEKFDRVAPGVKKTRDALTHFDEYLKGRGHQHRGKLQPGLRTRARIYFPSGSVEKYTIRVNVTPDLPDFEIEIVSARSAAFTLRDEILKVYNEMGAYLKPQ